MDHSIPRDLSILLKGSIGHPSILMPLLCRLAGSPGTSAHRDIPALIASPLCTGCHGGSVQYHPKMGIWLSLVKSKSIYRNQNRVLQLYYTNNIRIIPNKMILYFDYSRMRLNRSKTRLERSYSLGIRL